MTSWLQDPSLMAAILTTMLPFVSFLLIIAFTRNHRRLSGGIAIAAVAGSLAGAVFLLVRHWGATQPTHYAARWLITGDVTLHRAGMAQMIAPTPRCSTQIRQRARNIFLQGVGRS